MKPETIPPDNFIEPKVRNVILICVALAVITLAVYMQAGNHQFVNYDDNDTKAHINLGIALAEKSEVDSAIHEFQETLRLSPNNTDARNNLSRALALIKRPDKTRK